MRSRLVATCAVLAVMLLAAMPAFAQNFGTGYLGDARERYTVFFFGDILAAGMSSGMVRVLTREDRITAKGRFKRGSGLARRRYYDWPPALEKILERNEVDVAVMFIGANDARPIRDGDERAEFGTQRWREIYSDRVDEILQVFSERQIPVYWIGLPPMRSPQHEEAVKIISEVQAARVGAAGVRLIDLRPVLAAPDGSYTDQGEDQNGEVRRIRSRNGISFLKAGNNKIATLLLEALRHDIAVSDGLKSPDEAPPVAGEAGGADALPTFGMVKEDGEVVTLSERDLPRRGVVVISDDGGKVFVANNAAAGRIMKRLGQAAARGSAAERLFTEGVWPEVKPGRADDFSWRGE